jgi:hypothetical protein
MEQTTDTMATDKITPKTPITPASTPSAYSVEFLKFVGVHCHFTDIFFLCSSLL